MQNMRDSSGFRQNLQTPRGAGALINRPPSQLSGFLIVKGQQLKPVFNGRAVCAVITAPQSVNREPDENDLLLGFI